MYKCNSRSLKPAYHKWWVILLIGIGSFMVLTGLIVLTMMNDLIGTWIFISVPVLMIGCVLIWIGRVIALNHQIKMINEEANAATVELTVVSVK